MKKLRKIMKVICVLMAFAVMLSLFTACDQHDDRIDPTSRETETQITPDFSEPNQSIASSVATTETETSSSETATPTQSGAYTYEAYGYQFTMDVNLEDYVFPSPVDGNDCFSLYQLAQTYGWRPHRADGDTSYGNNKKVDWYEYDYGNGMVMVVYVGVDGSNNNPTGDWQVNTIGYTFRNYPITNGSPWGYEGNNSTEYNPLYGYSTFSVPNHTSNEGWMYLQGGPSVGSLTREDAIILAYLLSVGPQHPGENPIYYSDFINSGYDTGASGEYILPY